MSLRADEQLRDQSVPKGTEHKWNKLSLSYCNYYYWRLIAAMNKIIEHKNKHMDTQV